LVIDLSSCSLSHSFLCLPGELGVVRRWSP
jgi:hypothetical protein